MYSDKHIHTHIVKHTLIYTHIDIYIHTYTGRPSISIVVNQAFTEI